MYMKNTLIKSFTREFPLVHIQLWGRRYVKTFLGAPLPQIPMYVFIFKDGMATAYRNEEKLPKAVNSIIKKKIDADPLFIDHLVKEKSKVLAELTKADSATITSDAFITYLNNLFDYWQIHYISQFIPLDEKNFSRENREKCIELRKTIGAKVTNFWYCLTPILKRLYPEFGDLVTYISWDEIINYDIPSIKELNKRKVDGMILINDKIVSGEEFERLKNTEDFKLDEQIIFEAKTKEVHGETAFPGSVKGKVRIIMKIEEMKNFIEGEILISYVTIPAFVPIMKKAAAFVTDEGGITCHAAIIARELKKPCIIGTKNATQVFKNGDLVYVDADNGVVRILQN
jgi:phosphohistidine swiveling domain-containing protein